ncbi:uncharacterized protein METZ01_LOCUS180307, partial [marine metagenome]
MENKETKNQTTEQTLQSNLDQK